MENNSINFKYHFLLKDFKKLQDLYNETNNELLYVKNYTKEIIIKNTEKELTKYKKQFMIEKEKLIKKHKMILNDKDVTIKEKDKIIEALKEELARMASLLNNDSSNSGTPTSQTPPRHKKRNSSINSREKTDKLPGGQTGHKKHKLEAFSDEEATEIIDVVPEKCPNCGNTKIEVLDKSVDKCETDYIVKVIKRKFKFKECKCLNCNNNFREIIPSNLKEENQYGTTVQSLAICLTNEIYTPFNKTVKLIEGITDGEIKPSEGYVAKLQSRASKYLNSFINELKNYFPKQDIYAWDDGVIIVNTKNATLRTYCTDNVALFTAHERKNKESVDDDNILNRTLSSTIVMHDHFLLNYNKDYNFQNVECVIHLIRRVIKMQENTKHEWLNEFLNLIKKANKDRNNLIESNVEEFDAKYLKGLYEEYDNLLLKGEKENAEDKNNYFFKEELSFIKDLRKYKKNYLLWTQKFKLPSTNNISERNIRPVKSKMKISGQFKNINYAKYYANIRSYIETCKKNNINIIEACVKLMEGNPYTLEEILNYKPNNS